MSVSWLELRPEAQIVNTRVDQSRIALPFKQSRDRLGWLGLLGLGLLPDWLTTVRGIRDSQKSRECRSHRESIAISTLVTLSFVIHASDESHRIASHLLLKLIRLPYRVRIPLFSFRHHHPLLSRTTLYPTRCASPSFYHLRRLNRTLSPRARIRPTWYSAHRSASKFTSSSSWPCTINRLFS